MGSGPAGQDSSGRLNLLWLASIPRTSTNKFRTCKVLLYEQLVYIKFLVTSNNDDTKRSHVTYSAQVLCNGEELARVILLAGGLDNVIHGCWLRRTTKNSRSTVYLRCVTT